MQQTLLKMALVAACLEHRIVCSSKKMSWLDGNKGSREDDIISIQKDTRSWLTHNYWYPTSHFDPQAHTNLIENNT